MSKKIAQILALVTSATLIAGCASSEKRSEADRALENKLRAEQARYGDLAENEPNVYFHARDGIVTLSGTVRTAKDREMLETMTRNTTGVVAVNDELGVLYSPTGAPSGYPPAPVYRTPPPAPPAPVVTPGIAVAPSYYPDFRIQTSATADEAVARQIGDQLRLDSVSGDWLRNVTITVSGGNAYVRGTVDTQEEHDAIISSARHARGVSVVYDQLQVR